MKLKMSLLLSSNFLDKASKIWRVLSSKVKASKELKNFGMEYEHRLMLVMLDHFLEGGGTVLEIVTWPSQEIMSDDYTTDLSPHVPMLVSFEPTINKICNSFCLTQLLNMDACAAANCKAMMSQLASPHDLLLLHLPCLQLNCWCDGKDINTLGCLLLQWNATTSWQGSFMRRDHNVHHLVSDTAEHDVVL
jgi:hypothetical protein